MQRLVYILLFLFAAEIFAQDTGVVTTTNVFAPVVDSIKNNEDTIVYSIPYFIPDSILQLADTIAATAEWQPSPPSVFTAQAAGRIIPNPSRKRPQWLFVLFILQMLALIYIKATGLKNIEDSLKAYFNINLSQQLFREQENAISFSMLVQVINFFISTTVMLYLIADYFFKIDNEASVKIVAVIFLFTTLVYFSKYMGYRLLSNLFSFSDEIDLFRFNYFLNQKLLGIFLLPFVYAAAYAPQPYSNYFLLISIAIFVLSIAVRSFKGIVIGSAYLQKHTFHFLLYICTFEIAPVLILIKWLQITGYGQN